MNNDDTITAGGDDTLAASNDDVVVDPTPTDILNGMSALAIIAYLETRPDVAAMQELTATRKTIENTMTELAGKVDDTLGKITALCGTTITHADDVAAFDGMVLGMMEGQRLGGQLGPSLDDINDSAVEWVAARQPADTVSGANADDTIAGNG